jgi:hypothetical protein
VTGKYIDKPAILFLNMPKTKRKKARSVRQITWRYGKRSVRFIIDRVVIFRLMRKLHGRFWGLAGLIIMALFFALCFAINPETIKWSTAFSDFGRDVKTAPYLAAGMFFGAYGLWRWRRYLKRTLRHARPLTGLIGLTVTGLYIAALMPVAWEPWPYRIHLFGVILFSASMAATVVIDTLLTRTRRNKSLAAWRMLRALSFLLILVGAIITYGSSEFVDWFRLSLLGEILIMIGYTIWIVDKTYRGEGERSQLSKMLHKIVLID